MKAIWNGAIGFGLVNIPIKIYSAVQESNLDFDMLDKKDHANIKFKRVNENTGKEVLWENIVKGYKIDDNYVIVEDADFEAASPEKNKLLSIEQFVKEEEIDNVYYESPYFLEPQKNGENAYMLLLESLIKTGMAGVGTFILRDKESIGAIRPYRNNILVLNRLRFSNEIRSYDELNIPSKKNTKPAELKMAITLIEQLSEKFDPKKYTDTYSAALLKIIENKAKGKKNKSLQKAKAGTKTIDLMEQLKASLQSINKRKTAS